MTSGSSSVFSSLHSHWDWWSRYKEPGDTATVDVQTIYVAILHMSLKSASLNDGWFFLAKNKTSNLGTTLLKCQIIWIFKLLDVRLKEVIHPNIIFCKTCPLLQIQYPDTHAIMFGTLLQTNPNEIMWPENVLQQWDGKRMELKMISWIYIKMWGTQWCSWLRHCATSR